ncbi:hypothetical protein RUND412_003737 [Rhizina undulata]
MAETTTHQAAPTGLVALLIIAEGGAAGFQPVPKDFFPPNLKPGYVPENQGPLVFTVGIIAMTLAFLTVAARLGARVFLLGKFGSDDWFIIPGTFFAILLALTNCLGVKYGGLGKHAWDVTFEEVERGLQLELAHILIYVGAMFFIKASILFFIQRLNAHVSTFVDKFIIGCFVYQTMLVMSAIFTFSFQCKPAAAVYTLSLRFTGAKCMDTTSAYYTLSALHLCSDFVLLALPITMVIHLQMPRQKKYIVLFIFSLGGLACISAMIRMIYFIELKWDISWYLAPAALWGQLETSLALISASIPGLKPLLMKYMPQISKTKFSNSFPNLKSIETPTGNEDDSDSKRGALMLNTYHQQQRRQSIHHNDQGQNNSSNSSPQLSTPSSLEMGL